MKQDSHISTVICQQHRDREVWKLLYSKVTVPFAHLRGESNWGTATLQGIPLLLTSILESSHVYSIHVFSTGIQFQNCTDSELAWNSSSFFFKKPLVRQQSLDGSGPEACCSCTRVHGNQRRRLAKLPWHQFGNGCSLCNGAGLCSAPGAAFFQSKSFVAKNPWVLFQFFLFVPSLAATSALSGFSKFWGSLLLHFLGLFGDVSICYHSLSLLSPLVMCW